MCGYVYMSSNAVLILLIQNLSEGKNILILRFLNIYSTFFVVFQRGFYIYPCLCYIENQIMVGVLVSGFIGVGVDKIITQIIHHIRNAIQYRNELGSLANLVRSIQPLIGHIQQYRPVLTGRLEFQLLNAIERLQPLASKDGRTSQTSIGSGANVQNTMV